MAGLVHKTCIIHWPLVSSDALYKIIVISCAHIKAEKGRLTGWKNT